MRVLLATHNFPPNHTGGTEIYTLQLGRELARRGHDVRVFTADKDIGRPDLSLAEHTVGGLPVIELTNNLHYRDFRETWESPAVDRVFGELLDRLKPDVVHFQHLLYLSLGCVSEAARRGVPVLFTLHDYWLQCPRYGQRIHAEGSICDTIDFHRCGECLADFKFAQSGLERRLGGWISRLRSSSGLNLAPAARGLSRALRERGKSGAGFDRARLDPERVERREREVRERAKEFLDRLLPAVHRFLAPSRFLREQFIEWGIPAEQIQFLRTGIDVSIFKSEPRARPPPGSARTLKVGFIGSLVPAKGPHVLLDAWGFLPAELRGHAELLVYGPERHEPAYVAKLRERAVSVGAKFLGGLSRDDVARVLATLDLLVVPSVWYENSPLIIIEAIATRTPLAVSDIGGMAELVKPGISGFHFRAGSASDLAALLERVLRRPEILGELYRADEPTQRVEEDAAQIEELYLQATQAVRAAQLAARP